MTRWDRETVREIFDLNPFAAKMLSSWLNNSVGYGITATVKGNKRAKDAWKLWERYCDYDDILDLYGLQELVARTRKVDGEVFIILRIKPNPSGVPLQLQVLDADMLDTTTAVAATRIRDGIEYDADGVPVAYHFKQSREIDAFSNPIRVPAAQVIHLYRRKRPGQRRGRSDFEPVLEVLEDVDGYLEAEGIRKKIAACFVGFRQLSEEADDPTMGTIETPIDPDEPPVESFFPGMIINGRPGETMDFGQPPRDSGISEYMRWGGLRMAAGGETTYEHVTSDLSNVNYSSYRAGNMEFARSVGREQWLLFIPRFLAKIAEAWSEAAYLSGAVSSRKVVVEWTPPPFGSVDRGKDILADILEMKAGVSSRRKVAGERGYDIEDLSDEIAEDQAMLESKGLAFEGDPLAPAAEASPSKDGVAARALDLAMKAMERTAMPDLATARALLASDVPELHFHATVEAPPPPPPAQVHVEVRSGKITKTVHRDDAGQIISITEESAE